MSITFPYFKAFASLGEAEREFNEKTSKFIGDAEEARDIIELLDKDAKANPNPNRNSISFVMRRLFYPGYYANDMRDGILAMDIKASRSSILHDGKHACNPNAPNNLINHNCNIPNFTTSLFQNVAEPFTSPLVNAEKTSSHATFGLGVPANIPGGIVPADPRERRHTYTALELYGYDLKLTSYSGEWDQVVVSNSARMLSNFGVIDSITLAGATVWNSYKNGISAFVDNMSFNPVRWFGTFARTFEATATSGINTVVDTSELNVIATNAWKRPNIDKTLYNIYVMSDKEVLRETARGYFEVFSNEMSSKVNDSKKLQEVLDLDPNKALDTIAFSYDPNMETEKSKEARKKAKEERDKIIEHNEKEEYKADIEGGYKDGNYKPDIKPVPKVPKPVYYTESEQLDLWSKEEEVSSVIKKASAAGLVSNDMSTYETYEDFKDAWNGGYDPYFTSSFSADGETIEEILKDTDGSVFQKYPHLDPKQGISKYACMNTDGSMMRSGNGMPEYLYLKNNSGSKEYLNPLCGQTRPPLAAGLFGSGWESKEIKDTRHVSNVSTESLVFDKIKNITTSGIRTVNSLIAKFTNVVVGLAFTPILSALGIDTIIAKFIESFKNTIFFPLAGIVAAVGAMIMFFRLLKNGSAWQLISTIALTLFIFVAGSVFLLHPKSTVSLVDTLPNSIDNFMATTILAGTESSYCSTGEDVSGVRSAQCSVWGAMVFEPWVHLQFGTGYENLYAAGKAPSDGQAMMNKNGKLVGNATVDMGNGKLVHNWAMYQLSKTKTGTINDFNQLDPMGHIDKDMYRLVDLQAGPNYGENADSRYFKDWSGSRNGSFLLFLTTIQSVMMMIAISGVAMTKIQVSFMFSISVLFFPVMLLYALMPNGRSKFIQYISGLVSLLIKRAILVVLLSVLLRVIIVGYSKANSIEAGAFVAIFTSIAFMIYRKELMNLITSTESKGIISGETKDLKQALGKVIPKNIKQSYQVQKANVKGATAGYIGGTIGALEDKAGVSARRAGIAMTLSNLERKERKSGLSEVEELQKDKLLQERKSIKDSIKHKDSLPKEELEMLEEERRNALKIANSYEEEINKLYEEAERSGKKVDENKIKELQKEVDYHNNIAKEREEEIIGGSSSGDSVGAQARKGAAHSKGVIGRVSERKVRAEGFAALTAYRDIKEQVYSEGARKIVEAQDSVAHDTYREVLSQTKDGKSKANDKIAGSEHGDLMKPKLQKKIRKIAEQRRKEVDKKDQSDALRTDSKDIELAARIIDKRRSVDTIKTNIKHPTQIRASNKLKNEENLRKLEQSSSIADGKDLIERDIRKGKKADEHTVIARKEVEVYLEREESRNKETRRMGDRNREEAKKIAKDSLEIKEKRKKFEEEGNINDNEK